MSGSQIRNSALSGRLVQSLKELAEQLLPAAIRRTSAPAASRPAAVGGGSAAPADGTSESQLTADAAVAEQLQEETAPPAAVGQSRTWHSYITLPASQSEARLKAKSTPKWKLQSSTTKMEVDNRTRHLVSMIRGATTDTSRLSRVEALSEHLLKYPQSRSLAYKEGATSSLLTVSAASSDVRVKALTREALCLIGHVEPPSGRGLRVLSIDGGGIRGLVAIELLRELERLTGRPVYRLFDLICGVSTGAMLAFLVGPLRRTLDDVETMYRELGTDVFHQTRLRGTTKLLWDHSYYDTEQWNKVLVNTVGECRLSSCAQELDVPKVAAVSTLIGINQPKAYVFRTYNHPFHVQSQYQGSSQYKLWEAVRASAAAPGYFSEFRLGGLLFQDGGLVVNNPAGIALYEARRLWAREPIQCLVSLGTGRFAPASFSVSDDSTEPQLPSPAGSTSWVTKLLRVLDSATDTEGVHAMLHDLLPVHQYFRLNPYLSGNVSLDDASPDKLNQLKLDSHMYIRKNAYKFGRAATELSRERRRHQKLVDYYHHTRARHGI